MKKQLILMAMLLIASVSYAQNVQMHYDFGGSIYDKELSSRPVVTTTVESFKADKWGSTFFFIDMDYTSEGVGSAYWEISRQLKFWDNPFSIHVEYNGGLVKGASFNNCYLSGITYTYNNDSYSRGFGVSALYKYIQKHKNPNNFQLTANWYMHFKQGLYTFSGFADWWRETNPNGNFIFMAEPQFWLNLNKIKGVSKDLNLSIGTEVELTNNFGFRKGFYAIPTIAAKWSFN